MCCAHAWLALVTPTSVLPALARTMIAVMVEARKRASGRSRGHGRGKISAMFAIEKARQHHLASFSSVPHLGTTTTWVPVSKRFAPVKFCSCRSCDGASTLGSTDSRGSSCRRSLPTSSPGTATGSCHVHSASTPRSHAIGLRGRLAKDNPRDNFLSSLGELRPATMR